MIWGVRYLRKLDWTYIRLFLLLLIGSSLSYLYNDNILLFLKAFFEIKDLNLFAGGIAAMLTITHKIKYRKIKFKSSMSFNEFRIPLEEILSFVGNPITLVCAISLAKGIFLQASEHVKYFPFFQDIELTFIGIVAAYLFFQSIMEMLSNIRQVFTNDLNSTDELTPIPEKEITKSVPKPS